MDKINEIIEEIDKVIADTRECGKHHSQDIRDNGEILIRGLEIAKEIINEKMRLN